MLNKEIGCSELPYSFIALSHGSSYKPLMMLSHNKLFPFSFPALNNSTISTRAGASTTNGSTSGNAFPLRNQNGSQVNLPPIKPRNPKTQFQFPQLSQEEENELHYKTSKWGKETSTNISLNLKGMLAQLLKSVDENDEREVISLGLGDPTSHSCFQTTLIAEEAVADALKSRKFNGYSPSLGLLQTRKAIAEYLSRDLPYKLSSDDVYVTSGCTQAIDVAMTTLARPGGNILIPKPGFPIHELCAEFRNLEVRNFDLLPEKGWEFDLDGIEALVDRNTVALVIINPGNPCANVYSYHQLEKIAKLVKKLGISVIADEVYGHLAFGSNPFVPMAVFGSDIPVLTLGSISKRWLVPGWRLGWFVTTDPNGIYKSSQIIERTKNYFDILGAPATFVQAAVPQIFEQTEDVFFQGMLGLLKQSSDICWQRIKEIPCLSCPQKPEGSMAAMVKLNLSLLKDINDDIDFCFKLVREESVILLPGTVVGMRNWIRITFAVDPSSLEEAFDRIKSFCQRNSRQKTVQVRECQAMEQLQTSVYMESSVWTELP